MPALKYKDSNGQFKTIVGYTVKNDVVQTTGSSTTSVMSQSAVTELVDGVVYFSDTQGTASTSNFDAELDTVHVKQQTLTSEQKQQARTNIDALGTSSLSGYATEVWVGEQGYITAQDIDGFEDKTAIVEGSGTTLSAETGNYYRFDSAVSSLAVTLPTIASATTIQGFVIYLTTSSSISLTFSGGTVKYQDGYEIKASSTYEINAIYNGAVWVIAAIKIV
jgi:hypothetical protein